MSQDLYSPYNYNHNAVVRAQAMGVALIDSHILRNKDLMKRALGQVLTGKYKGPEKYE